MRADMSGKKEKVLVTHDRGGTRIRSITLDSNRRLIYYIDLEANAIFEISYNPEKGKGLQYRPYHMAQWR